MSASRTSIAAVALIGLLLAGCQTPLPKVEGWRALTAGEAKALAEARRAENPAQPPPLTQVNSDFNRDGQPDKVVLLVNEAGDRFAPYLFDGAGAPPVALGRGDHRDRMHRYSLSILPAGAIYGMCVEEAEDLSDCQRDKDLPGHLIVFFEVDHGGSLYVWNGQGYEERSMRKDTYNLSRARPADEHPLARHPAYVVHRQMKPDPSLPTFQPVDSDGD